MFKGLSFRDLHRYIIEGVILISLIIGAAGLVLYELHGLVRLVRYLWRSSNGTRL